MARAPSVELSRDLEHSSGIKEPTPVSPEIKEPRPLDKPLISRTH
jgi:hypothetical protein